MLPLFLVLSYLGQVIAAGKDVETPLLQITVPEKIDTNIQDAKEAETQVIKKPDIWKMTGHLRGQN
uniref:ADAM metallopeptidase domain 3 n=1 Tax=Mus musculus TaxID=10090 RepID=E9PYS3_MOUSE